MYDDNVSSEVTVVVCTTLNSRISLLYSPKKTHRLDYAGAIRRNIALVCGSVASEVVARS
jgi:hypothetical protein